MAKKRTIRKRAPLTRNAGTLTETEYFSKIRSALRNAFRYWKPMMLALEKASRPSQSSNKRIKKEYQCAKCLKWRKRADIQIDHIEECGSLRVYEDIVPFIKRLTKEDINCYQLLCADTCHKIKTKKYLKTKREERKLIQNKRVQAPIIKSAPLPLENKNNVTSRL